MNDTIQAFPDKQTMQTECTGADHPWKPNNTYDFHWWMDSQSVGAVNMGTNGALGWNLCLDENHGPQNGFKNIGENGGCTDCRGLLTIDFSQPKPRAVYHPEFYALAQVSAFVHRRASRVDLSGDIPPVQASAFLNPDGTMALVAHNWGDKPIQFRVRRPDHSVLVYEIPAQAATSFFWREKR
jgi:glucosylceramidase